MFKHVVSGTAITAQEATERYGLTEVVWAEEFSVGENLYVVYFDTCKQKDECYSLNFAAIGQTTNALMSRRALLSHRLTHTNTGYVLVLTKVLHTLLAFLEATRPKMVSFSGADPRQQEFYNRVLEKMPIPEQYSVDRRNDLLVITINE